MTLVNPQIPANLISKLGVPQLIDIREKLPVNKNYTWAQLGGVRKPEDITTIVCHHDAYPKKNRVGKSDLDLAIEIAKDHIANTNNVPKGDAGFPYDIWIRNGNAYLCNDSMPLKYCVASNNTYTLHVCVSGDYHNYDTLTDQDRNMLYAVILMWKADLGATYAALKGHGEIKPKDCPGYDMNRVRTDVTGIEASLRYDQSATSVIAEGYKMLNQFQYLYNMMAGKRSDGSPATPGEKQWAMGLFMKLKPFLDSNGIKY